MHAIRAHTRPHMHACNARKYWCGRRCARGCAGARPVPLRTRPSARAPALLPPRLQRAALLQQAAPLRRAAHLRSVQRALDAGGDVLSMRVHTHTCTVEPCACTRTLTPHVPWGVEHTTGGLLREAVAALSFFLSLSLTNFLSFSILSLKYCY